MKTREEILEAGRLRAKRHYEANKDVIKAKNLSKYHEKRQENDLNMIQMLADKYQLQIQQAKNAGWNVVTETKPVKYNKCIWCNHYTYLTIQTVITPTGAMVNETRCPICKKKSHKLLYNLHFRYVNDTSHYFTPDLPKG
jgi:hypothetical protein